MQPVRPVTPTETTPPIIGDGTNRFSFHGNLSLENLTVRGKINGVNFDDLLSSLFLKGINQHIEGTVFILLSKFYTYSSIFTYLNNFFSLFQVISNTPIK